MRPSFHPRLINGPFDDPGLFIPFAYENRAILFDLGDLSSLTAKDILKIGHVFVTHTHMDHFIGFDRLLRLQLGRKKRLRLYGPAGFLDNIEGKLKSYTWNLLDNYSEQLTIEAMEVRNDMIRKKRYGSRSRFQPSQKTVEMPFSGILYSEPRFTVTGSILDHGIPCIGFSLNETFHVNVMKERIEEMGFRVGPWLNRFKQALYAEKTPESTFPVPDGNNGVQTFLLSELSEKIARISRGMKITYIADVAYHTVNIKKIIDLARDADHLFIEGAFLQEDEDLATTKHHLTAHQAGTLSRKAGVKRMSVFHFSPRYTGLESLLEAEAQAAMYST